MAADTHSLFWVLYTQSKPPSILNKRNMGHFSFAIALQYCSTASCVHQSALLQCCSVFNPQFSMLNVHLYTILLKRRPWRFPRLTHWHVLDSCNRLMSAVSHIMDSPNASQQRNDELATAVLHMTSVKQIQMFFLLFGVLSRPQCGFIVCSEQLTSPCRCQAYTRGVP